MIHEAELHPRHHLHQSGVRGPVARVRHDLRQTRRRQAEPRHDSSSHRRTIRRLRSLRSKRLPQVRRRESRRTNPRNLHQSHLHKTWRNIIRQQWFADLHKDTKDRDGNDHENSRDRDALNLILKQIQEEFAANFHFMAAERCICLLFSKSDKLGFS